MVRKVHNEHDLCNETNIASMDVSPFFLLGSKKLHLEVLLLCVLLFNRNKFPLRNASS